MDVIAETAITSVLVRVIPSGVRVSGVCFGQTGEAADATEE